MKRQAVVRTAMMACALCLSTGLMAQTTPITFNPKGTGDVAADKIVVGVFDWVPGNAVAIAGNPAGGLVVGSKVVFLAQSRLGSLIDPNGVIIALPTDRDFTFIAGSGEAVTTTNGVPATNVTLGFDASETDTNFFEMWVKPAPPLANMLAGTGFGQTATGTRIMYGKVIDMAGNFATSTCAGGAAAVAFDQFLTNNWPSTTTICGVGSTDVSVEVLQADPNYFPGFTPGQVADLKAFFNTSTVVPFKQADPSQKFTANDAGVLLSDPELLISPVLGPVNGAFHASGDPLDFQFQADANQSFVVATTVAGGCRVTYGGNDKNGNIAPNSFGQACSSDKGNQQNCYTFGGQVGAPSIDPVFGEHTHHQVSGPAGDFVFRAGTHSAPKSTKITAAVCKDPGACRQAEANAGFKQIDFEGTGSFRTLDATATAYLSTRAGHPVVPDSQKPDQIYYFRVDMDDTGEPGNKPSKKQIDIQACGNFFAADLNQALNIGDPPLLVADGGFVNACGACADVYQFFICKDENPCDPQYDKHGNPTNPDVIYHVRGFMTGGNIQIHKQIK